MVLMVLRLLSLRGSAHKGKFLSFVDDEEN